MGNRKRLDTGMVEQVKGYLADVLTESGEVTIDQRRLVAEMVDRSERQIARYVDDVAGELGLAPAPKVQAATHDSGIDAMLDRGAFTFADPDLKRLCLAYAGNLKALYRDAKALADKLELGGPVGYVQMTRKFNDELAANERGLIRRGIKGFKEASLYLRWSAGYRNEVWQIDASEMDLWVMPAGTSQRVRPWGLFIVDDYSRVILAASLMLHDYTAEDSAACVHRAMRMRTVTLPDGRDVQVGGLPDKILCDNALQFTGQVLSHVAQTLGFTMWAVAAYAGEKKGKVERVVRAANEGWARKLPGYAHRALKTLTMRDALHANDQQLLSEQQALDELGKWVEEWNNSAHPQFPGKSRYQVWADDTHGLQQVDEELLVPATVAMPRSSYVYGKDGFRIQRKGAISYYVDTTGTLDVRDRYILRHLPGEQRWIDAYDLDGRHLVRCWDASLVDEDTARDLERRRRETYRSISSLRSEAVELRSVAAAEAADTDERPQPLVTAHQKRLSSPAPDLVRQSLGLPDAAELTTGDPAPDLTDAEQPDVSGPSDDSTASSYDDLAEQAVGYTITDGETL